MSELRELYQQTILDHSREPRNFGALAGENRGAEGYNPLCGDRITLHLEVADGVIRNASFEGAGCAIETASASLMTEAIKGLREDEALRLLAGIRAMLTGGETDVEPGKLAALAGVREFPQRIKCATLPWHTLAAALRNARTPVATE